MQDYLYHALGIIESDGSVFTSNQGKDIISLCSKELSFIETFKKCLLNLGVKSRKPYFDSGRNLWVTQTTNRIFFKEYHENRNAWLSKLQKGSDEQIWSFLCGFFEGDGSCYPVGRGYNHYYIDFTKTDKQIVDFVYVLLKNLGFHPKLQYYKRCFPRKPIWHIRLYRQKEVEQFIRKTNPIIKRGKW